jgi:tetratricopeptide (TPR) repeat protein
LREDVARFYDLVERARYAPVTGVDGDPSEVLALARALIRGLERERNMALRGGVLASVIVVALVISSMPLGARARQETAEGKRRDPHTIFYEGNAAYKNGDHEGAAREYERLRSAGFESSALSYNLGNAYFKRQMYGRALLEYERARRLAPRDADIEANLEYTRERAKVPALGMPVWQRVLFAPSQILSTAELSLLWASMWWGAWASIALLEIGGSAGARIAAWTTGTAVVIVGASLAFHLWRYELSADAVVTAPATAVARFEPSAAGKEYFRLREGSIVNVRRTRQGWVQVSRPDGKRGWVPADAVEQIAS